MTSTYFEGEMAGCPMAKRGYSRDSRGDRPQVCIGLVVTEDGFPLGYEVFAGNTHDSKTVQTIDRGDGEETRRVESRLGDGPRHGERREPEIPARARRAVHRRHAQGDAAAVRAASCGRKLDRAQEGVEVKLVSGPDGEETFILARSADRRAKEQAMHEKFTARMEEGLCRRCRPRRRPDA